MGVEGRDKEKALEAGAVALSGQLGKTVQRLRKAYNLSLSELSEQSGVAKSIISQIERNETNPTLATIWRLAQALDVSIERVLQDREDGLHRKVSRATRRSLSRTTANAALPSSAGSRRSNGCNGMISPPNRAGCWNPSPSARLRGMSLRLEGELEVEVAGETEIVRTGETLRYRADRRHVIRNPAAARRARNDLHSQGRRDGVTISRVGRQPQRALSGG